MYEEKGPVVISTSFNESGRRRAEQLSKFLELFEVTPVYGEFLGGQSVSKGISDLLRSSWFVVVILSRSERLGENLWRPPDWVMHEALLAKGCEKECLYLIEEGVQLKGTLLGDVEYLPFRDESFSDVLIPFGRQLRAILHRNLLTARIVKMPVHTHVSDEPLGDECTDEAKFLLLQMRYLTKQQRYEEARELAEKAMQADPNCWRARTSLGALLVKLGQVNDGDKLFTQVLEEFSGNPKGAATALHNRAWVQEIRAGLEPSADSLREQLRLYEMALKLDASRVNTRACLLICTLLLGETGQAERILEDSVLCEGFLDALRSELDAHSAVETKPAQALPERLGNLLRALPRHLRHLLYDDAPSEHENH
jgi:tetratricopeptide (TPR) repeat protein